MDIRDIRGDFVGINVTDGAQNTQLSQRASRNGIKQSTDRAKSITFYGFQSEMSGRQSIQQNRSSLFHRVVSKAPRLRISQMENNISQTRDAVVI